MSIINKTPLKNKKIEIQQSDIVIDIDGNINISFLWEDLQDLFQEETNLKKSHTNDYPSWSIPSEISVKESFDEYQECYLCPKECGFNRVQSAHPNCGDAFLRVSNVGVSLGDEPMIRGSRGSGTIMLSGCPLTCPSCHNPEKVASGEKTSLLEFLNLCKKLLDSGAHNIQILSPTVHLPNLRIILKILKETQFPLPIVFKSSGYESIEQLKKLNGLVDVYLPDFKFGTCSQWGKRAGVNDYFQRAKEALNEMYNQVGEIKFNADDTIRSGVLVRHVRAPLPEGERNEIDMFLTSLPDGIEVSYNDHFVVLE